MKITTKGRYGFRFMLDMALHEKEGPVTLKDISRRQGISEKYLWQVSAPLKFAGLLKATPGLHGGYSLEQEPAEITIKQLLDVLEGNEGLVECLKTPKQCNRSGECVARRMWSEIDRKIGTFLESITLRDVMGMEQERQDAESLTYYI
jgi:Rrf2 family protein